MKHQHGDIRIFVTVLCKMNITSGLEIKLRELNQQEQIDDNSLRFSKERHLSEYHGI